MVSWTMIAAVVIVLAIAFMFFFWRGGEK